MCPDHPSVQDGWGAAPEGGGQLSPPGELRTGVLGGSALLEKVRFPDVREHFF
jgi:hypothetical protein